MSCRTPLWDPIVVDAGLRRAVRAALNRHLQHTWVAARLTPRLVTALAGGLARNHFTATTGH